VKKYLSFDIGGTFIKYGVIKDNPEILEVNKLKTPATLNELLNIIEKSWSANQEVAGIAISSPGAVSDEGIIYGSSAIPYIHGPNIKKLVEQRTNLPVFIGNDANCAAYAEVWDGAAKEKKDVLVMVIGTGIGGSIIKDGLLHKGAHLHGGEFGYMLLTTNVRDSNDLWARTASTKALVKKVAHKKGVSIESLSGEKIFRLADAGDKDCIQAIDEFYHLLALGIFNLQYIYDPEVILIGGGISARKELIENVNHKLDKLVSSIDLANIKPNISACKFRQNANLLGAVYGFLQAYG
jgi:predicted NBD/HSP70 family sugar kinase